MPTDWFQSCYADWVLQYGKDEADKMADEWIEYMSVNKEGA